MINLEKELTGVTTVAMAGHVRPDGDAIGSCLGLFHYLKKNFPSIDATVYLETVPQAFKNIHGVADICTSFDQDKEYDVFFCLDCADAGRLGGAAKYQKAAKKTICIDHHVSNGGFGDVNYIVPDASSTCELMCHVLDEEKLPFESAEALYMGIAHDTGVFRHSCTTPETMEIAARLMRKGINCSRIINETFYDKTYLQNQILGRTLLESILLMDKKVIFSAVRLKEMEFYGVVASDLEGIVETLVGTTGVEAAIFLHETSPQVYKVSLRSRELIDVSVIASYFGGGGHVRAAGFNMQGNIYDVVNNITLHMEKQLLRVKDSD